MTKENNMFISKIKDKARREGAIEELELLCNKCIKYKQVNFFREEIACYIEGRKEKLIRGLE